jgi:acyl transferase domain-containing protein
MTDSPILFILRGRTQTIAGMGRELYAHEKVFREAIEACDIIIRDVLGFSILSNFKESPDQLFFEDEAKLIITIAAVQIGLVDLWKSKGIHPDGVLGVSQGEPMAIYAAGGLTLEDTLRIFGGSSRILELEKKEFANLIVNASMIEAQHLFKECPVWAEPVYEVGAKTIFALCHLNDVGEVSSFLRANNIVSRRYQDQPSWPYHTTRIGAHRQKLGGYMGYIKPRPLQCDYYSSLYGRVIPKNTVVGADFFFDMLRKPVLYHTTSTIVAEANFKVAVHIGPHPFFKGQMQKSFLEMNKKIVSIDTMRNGAPEMITFQSSLEEIRKIKPALTAV